MNGRMGHGMRYGCMYNKRKDEARGWGARRRAAATLDLGQVSSVGGEQLATAISRRSQVAPATGAK